MLAQQSSSIFSILRDINPEMLGAVMILATIGFFVTSIVTVVTICSTWNNMTALRMHHNLVKDLLSQGYSVEDIERLVYGKQFLGRKFKNFFNKAKKQMFSSGQDFTNRPAPPVKQSA